MSTPTPETPTPDLAARVTELQAELKKAGEALQRIELQGRIERAALEARALDPLRVAKAISTAITSHPDTPIERVIAELKREQPTLFAATTQPIRLSAMAPATPPLTPDMSPLSTLAKRATQGDRKALADYLRARRSA